MPAGAAWPSGATTVATFGRLRSITSAADGDLLITTDNGARDRVLRVSPR